MSLFILLVFVCLKAEHIVNKQKGLIVELKQDTKESQIDNLVQKIQSSNLFPKPKIQHIGGQEALITMSEVYPDLSSLDMSGVFKDVILIFYYPEDDKINFSDIKSFFDDCPEVDQLIIDQDNSSSTSLLGRYKYVAAGICLFLILIIALIVISHVKLALQQSAEKINVMYMAGANETFIKRPFFKTGFRTSVTALIVGTIIFFFIATILNKSLLIGSELSYLEIGVAVVIIWIIGFSLILGTTYIIVNLYLKKYYNQFANT